jgi:hypothetical protein
LGDGLETAGRLGNSADAEDFDGDDACDFDAEEGS